MSKIFSLSLDDFSPHQNAGLNFESIVWCNKLVEKYPDIKIDLFVPAAYARLNEQQHYLTNFPKWVDQVRALPNKNYRICPHGLFHRRSVTDFGFHKETASNNDEFQSLNKNQAETIIYQMLEEFKNVGLKYSKVFRPPGWTISSSSAEVLTAMGFIIAGDSKHYESLNKRISGLRWASANWHLIPDVSINGDIVAAGHTSNWMHNFFNQEKYNLLCEMLDGEQYEFKFLEEIV